MSYGAFGSTTNIFSDGGVGGGSPVRSSTLVESVGNIMCFPFKDDLLDTTGNHVIDAGSFTLETQAPDAAPNNLYSYDQNSMLNVTTVSLANSLITANSRPHQIPHTEPVSFGFFFFTRAWPGSTPEFMSSGDFNYGLQRQVNNGWRFATSGIAAMGDQRNKVPAARWTHIVMTVTANRASGPTGTFYINGTAVWTGGVANAGTVSSTDNFSFAADHSDTTSRINGFMANVFVTDTLLDSATIKALSDECFGHASPYTPGI